MTTAFQEDAFQDGTFQIAGADGATGSVCTGTAWGNSWAASWMEAWGGTCRSHPDSSSWACNWMQAWGGSWGDTSSCTVTVPPVVVTPPAPVLTPGGVGRAAWRDHYRKKPLPKRRRTLLEELDDQLLALRQRVEEQEASEQNEDVLRLGEEILASKQAQEISLIALRRQIEMVREAIQEMDDEDVILLAVH